MADECPMIADAHLLAAPQAADTDKVREAILAMPFPEPWGVLRHDADTDKWYEPDDPTAADIRVYSQRDLNEIRVAFADLAASMASQAPVREVPGWQLVPMEPTPKMLHAGGFKASAVGASTTGHDSYRAMLAAAPLPAAPVRQEGDRG